MKSASKSKQVTAYNQTLKEVSIPALMYKHVPLFLHLNATKSQKPKSIASRREDHLTLPMRIPSVAWSYLLYKPSIP